MLFRSLFLDCNFYQEGYDKRVYRLDDFEVSYNMENRSLYFDHYEIEHFHNLQNVYFDLTGRELINK